MNFKGFITAILTAIMLITMIPITFAGTFPDVNDKHSWAAKNIEDMVSEGLIKGYSDGTFKPDNSISKLEAVILASRILGVTQVENAEYVDAANNAFAQELSSYNIQYKKEVAYLLYWGVLNISELPSYISDSVKNSAMERYEVAVLLTKVMGGEKEAQANTMVVLDFSDDSQIPASAKPYVQYICDKGIMKGIDNNLFAPTNEVTRAMMATLMCRVKQSMDLETVNGNVTSVTPSVNKFEATVEGQSTSSSFELSSDELVNVDGLQTSLSNIKIGYDISIHYQGEGVRMVEALSTKSSSEVSGVINATGIRNGVNLVSVKPSESSESTTSYTLSNDCVIKVNNTETIFTSLSKGYYVKMSIKDGKVIKIQADTKEMTYTGTITNINLTGESPEISLKLKDGTTSNYVLMEDAVIIRNSNTDEVRNLAVGDSATITVFVGKVKKITAVSVNKTTEGIIEEIIISSTPSITLKVNGVSTKYTIAASTTFYVEDKAATIYDMKLGATASVSLKSENIDTIKITQTIVPSQLIGTVTSVNPLYNVISMNIVDSTTGNITATTVVVKTSVKIIDNTSTKVSTLKALTVGRSIIALGAIDNYGTYSVSTIIITQ